jgi:hypothetical protein
MLPERDRLSTVSAIAGRGGIFSGCGGGRFPVTVKELRRFGDQRNISLAIANERAGGAAAVRFR